MRTEITKLHNRLATTFIYVTHDQIEAMTMGTRIVVMKDGFMQQVDTPINLYDYPVNLFVAGFIGTPQMNFFEGVLTGEKDKIFVEFGNDKIELPKSKAELIVNAEKYVNTGRPIVFGVRPEDVTDDSDKFKEANFATINVSVEVVEALGPETLLYCKTSDKFSEDTENLVDNIANLIAKVGNRSTTKTGDKIDIAFNLEHCHLFDKETEVTIFARNAENKEAIAAIIATREAEEAEKAAKLAAKLAEEEAKAAALAEKQRIKLEKKLAKKGVPAEEVVEIAEEEKEAE
jgi:multiple sugar transport system ATP-binding protein